jgi:hypothetical protein
MMRHYFSEQRKGGGRHMSRLQRGCGSTAVSCH